MLLSQKRGMQCCIPCTFAHTACGLCGSPMRLRASGWSAFEVADLVGMDDIPLGELVEAALTFGRSASAAAFVIVLRSALHGIAGCLVIISVLEALCASGLTNPLCDDL